eukprot:CAMPEP_0194051048 /NCGR_PEP_ID=MMETSP0009_2-20130614/38189_1 /TAXON_ID=210454 /ORGANISM="Grammatophora oceanica, Strain CCMP 410" /LENGTH=83 /DNA_ID=CAMNT_0038697951 /DNA_START=43 /DNA_END=291 /DNA_ORIENTATION=+
MSSTVEDVTQKNRRRISGNRWIEEVSLSLDNSGKARKNSSLVGFGEDDTGVMAALGKHNAMDLQLYGYARKLCEKLGEGRSDI